MLTSLLIMFLSVSCVISDLLGGFVVIKDYFDEIILLALMERIEKRRAAKKGPIDNKTEKRIGRKIVMMFMLTAFMPIWLTCVIFTLPVWVFKLIKRMCAK